MSDPSPLSPKALSEQIMAMIKEEREILADCSAADAVEATGYSWSNGYITALHRVAALLASLPGDAAQDARPRSLRHGRDCPKIKHLGGGYLHADDDDGMYDVDGVSYCGRCHGWMGSGS